MTDEDPPPFEKLGALDYAQEQLMMDDTEIAVLLSDISAPEALAGTDWNEGWEPSKGEVDGDIGTRGTENKNVSVTPEAADRQRDIEKRLREAKSEDEKAMVRRELDTMRVVAVFSGEQAEVIKKALGTQQAERILHLCTKAVAEGDLPR